jgi:hypothetical protein
MTRYPTAVICLILASCNTERPTERVLRDKVNGVELIEQHLTGPALSQSEDKLYVVEGGERKKVFEGYGGSSLSLRSSRKGVLVVAYCGGSIRSTESFVVDDNPAGEVVAVKVQPIVASGLKIDGEAVCNDK